MSEKTSSSPGGPRPRRGVRWLSRKIGLVVLGIVIYAICIDVFGGYPRFHTEALSWIVVSALSVGAAIVWILSERRNHDE
jgi:uncharacterized membrane protein YdcZ (DUF606 family)